MTRSTVGCAVCGNNDCLYVERINHVVRDDRVARGWTYGRPVMQEIIRCRRCLNGTGGVMGHTAESFIVLVETSFG